MSIEVSEEQDTYRRILKATSLFGGVQIFTVLIGIIRVKFVAVLLGTVGVGIMGLLNAPINLIISITGLGIATSAVRDISEANNSGNSAKLALFVTTLRRWSWITGIFGFAVTIILSSKLSLWTFGNKDYTWAFIWLSITLLLQAINKGQNALLQGTRRLRYLAKASVIGSALGLATSIPLYYWLKVDGIVPAMLVSAVTSLTLSWFYSNKIKIAKVKLSSQEAYTSGFGMVKLGISMTLAGFIVSLSGYILVAFISNMSGVEEVGLYNAGWGVVGQYTGLIFTAMATDYFPRLSAVQGDNLKVFDLVKQQSETSILIMAPLLALLIVTMPIVVRIIYTAAFLPIVMFANLIVLGMQFKTVSWAMGYIFLAKGDGKLFLLLEIISGMVVLVLNLILYYFHGLNGLGISFVVTYIFGTLLYIFVLRKKYGFYFPSEFYKMFFITFGFVVLSFCTIFIKDSPLRYTAGLSVFLATTVFSVIKLNEVMDILSLFSAKFSK